ncbi:MAG: hypothetical protein AB1810_07255 [Pseudomonadota bacterium]
MLNYLKRYQGVFYPVTGIAAVFVILFFLAGIVGLDQANLPRPPLNTLKEYPAGTSLEEMVLLAEAGMWWLLLSFFFWLVGLFAVGFCWYQFHGATKHLATRRVALHVMILFTVVALVGILAYLSEVKNIPLMSFEFIVRNLGLVSNGAVNLTKYNTGLGIVVVAILLLIASLMLLPGVYNNDVTRQMRAITLIMYCGAAFLLVWVATSTEMYRFGAMLLVAEEREHVLKLAPTISLMAGAFSSLLLAAAYISSYLWLQKSFNRLQLIEDAGHKPAKGASPKDFLLAHWPKVTALLMPVLPGAIGTVMNLFAQPV